MRPPLHVLVVEDDPEFRDLVCALLRDAGAEAVGVENAEDAAKALDAHPVHVVLCDYFLPGRNGVAFLHEVRQKHPGTRCLAMTGHPDPFILGRGHDDGYFVVTKPVDPALLLALIGRGDLPAAVTASLEEAAAHS